MRIAVTFLVSILCALAAPDVPQVSAKSAIVIDAESGKALWASDAETPHYPASTTKIMTALLLIERCPLSDVIVAPADVEKINESSMHLKPGEKVTVGEMLYALMLRSANDGCYAVAVHISGSVKAFAALMNQRAAELGCTHTHFDNPNGLNDTHHFTSAHDLALIAREAMTYPAFRQVVKTQRHMLVRSINQADRMMVSKNKWLAKDPSADGIKTGWTIPAGHCYVGSATRNGYRLITVVMHSDHWQLDHQNMLNWGFKNHVRTLVASAGEQFDSVPLKGGNVGVVGVAPAKDVAIAEPIGFSGTVTHKVVVDADVKAPVAKGDTVGYAEFDDGTGFTERVPMVATDNVAKASVAASARSGASFVVIALGMGACLIAVKGRARRQRLYVDAA